MMSTECRPFPRSGHPEGGGAIGIAELAHVDIQVCALVEDIPSSVVELQSSIRIRKCDHRQGDTMFLGGVIFGVRRDLLSHGNPAAALVELLRRWEYDSDTVVVDDMVSEEFA